MASDQERRCRNSSREWGALGTGSEPRWLDMSDGGHERGSVLAADLPRLVVVQVVG